jgi:uncharacterized protein
MSAPGILVGQGDVPVHLLFRMANRHGMIAGATGTGKTVTLQTLAEGFSNAGVPVFLADVKGDLAGMSRPGGGNEKLEARAKEMGLTLDYKGFPVVFWDLFGQQGHPIRATVSEMGPLLISRLLGLNETQEGVLSIAFKLADDNGFLLLDLKDLRAMLTFLADNAADVRTEYGNVSSATVGAIQRGLLALEEQGGEQFFGEPALDLSDFMRTSLDGRGVVSVLAADKLMQTPKLYSTFLLWLLSELFEQLPEAGDLDKPKLVFFFDEAHLLFDEAPAGLVEKVEQVVRLVRSKGVGVYFVSQNPLDVPDSVLGQLGNRVQHALRAFTPRDQKAVQTAADTMRPNPKFRTDEQITQLGVGVALVSVLDEKGTPTVTEVTKIKPPCSRLGAVTPEERAQTVSASPVGSKYDAETDRESAYEQLMHRAQADAQAEAAEAAAKEQAKLDALRQKELEREQKEAERASRGTASRRSDSPLEAMMKSTMRAAGSQIGRQIVRGVLGGILGGLGGGSSRRRR